MIPETAILDIRYFILLYTTRLEGVDFAPENGPDRYLAFVAKTRVGEPYWWSNLVVGTGLRRFRAYIVCGGILALGDVSPDLVSIGRLA